MRVKLPTPAHGWRLFLGEVGVIVLGVLIALGAQQAVESWHWRQQVADSEQRFRQELDSSLANAYERLAIANCMNLRLAELRDQLIEPREEWTGNRLKLVKDVYNQVFPAVYRTPNRRWPQTTWQTALNGQVLNHFPAVRVAEISDLYTLVAILERLQIQELQHSAGLSDLAFSGPMTPAVRRDNLKRLGELDADNGRIMVQSQYLLDGARKAGVHLSARSRSSRINEQREYRGACVREPAIPAV